jgi:hypothetical protein
VQNPISLFDTSLTPLLSIFLPITTTKTLLYQSFTKKVEGARPTFKIPGTLFPVPRHSLTLNYPQLLFFHTLAHSLARAKTQLFCFQPFPHSLPQKRPGWGYPLSSPVRHICYSGKLTMIASSPLLPQNATRKRNLTP